MLSRTQILKKCFVNAPWYELKDRYLNLFLEHRIQPEIGFEGTCLYEEPYEEFKRIALLLRKHGLNCTLHAPFFELAPGALDPYILKASRNKLKKAFELIPLFQPKSIVCHLNFEENKQGYKQDAWSKIALDTWQSLLELAEKFQVKMMLENTYELGPAAHQLLLSRLASPFAGFCLDAGHLMSFAKNPWQDWLPALSPWLGQIHLHDNDGSFDQHLAPGLGNFDFPGLFTFLADNKLNPLITLEPHSEQDLWATLDYLETSASFARLF